MRVSEAGLVSGYSVPGGAADTAGLPIGCTIVAVNGKPVRPLVLNSVDVKAKW